MKLILTTDQALYLKTMLENDIMLTIEAGNKTSPYIKKNQRIIDKIDQELEKRGSEHGKNID